MEYPRVVRCRAAFGRSIVGTVLTGCLSIAILVYLFANGNSDGILAVVGAVQLLVVFAGTGIWSALGIPCKIIVDRNEVTFIIERGRHRTYRWDQIWAFES